MGGFRYPWADCGRVFGQHLNTVIEHALAVELRASGGMLTGEALPYGQPAQDRPEMFVSNPWATGLDTASLNLQHDREHVIAEQPDALTFTESPRGLSLRAQLRPDSAEARLVARGALQGLSVEFVSLDETQDRGMRVITRAHLAGVALVDRGSYDTTVELRARLDKAWFLATIYTSEPMACNCQGPECDRVQFEPGSFDLGEGDTLAVGGGGFSNVLGSLNRKTLIAAETEKGLEIGLTDDSTVTAKRIISDAAVADMYARPILDLEASEYTDEAGLRTFTTAKVRAILIKPTDTIEGHEPAAVEPRRRLWL